MRAFKQIDVFTAVPYRGNPVAVVLDGDGLATEEMQRFANWTNLSETTFVLPPSDDAADYAVRIFTPDVELPFAGHPTIGTCHAWLEAGGRPAHDDRIVQQCGVGLVELRSTAGRLSFAAPPLIRSGPVDSDDLSRICRVLAIEPSAVVAAEWVDNGPGWAAVLLDSAEAVLAVRPDFGAEESYDIGVVGPTPVGVLGPHDGDAAATGAAIEVRAFFRAGGQAAEDPVTGSLNASLAQWLIESGRIQAPYIAAQGTALGRAGRVHVEADGGRIWVGGDAVTCVDGSVRI